jgi:beta-N-acetylhexosaminidase
MRRNAALLLALVLAACSAPVTPAPSGTPSAVTTASPTASVSPSIAPSASPSPTATPGPTAPPSSAPGPTLAQMVGQKLVVAMSGLTASADLLGRIRRGEVGGVILFGSNISTAAQVTALTKQLQGAATAGGQPTLLISTDQEGGSVKRIKWAAPTLSPPQMGSLGSNLEAQNQGSATGQALAGLGINVDLAPVADVPVSTSSFMYQQGRTWSFSATTTANLSWAFAYGLQEGGALPAMKHFPGIGQALLNTDTHVVTITASKAVLAPGLRPYQKAILGGIAMIMLSNATYTAYDASNAAGWSRAIAETMLRHDLGFKGVTITDSLTGTAVSRGVTQTSLAIRAAKAGTDMLLVTGSEASTKAVYAALLAQAIDGSIPVSTLRESYDRIIDMKANAWASG